MEKENTKNIGYLLKIALACAFLMMIAFAVIPLVNSAEYSAHAATVWKKTGSGTQYYVSFPPGYNQNSALYAKYNRAPLQAYEKSTNKRVVNTTRVSWIYWHWTFSCGVLPNDNYNVYINDHSCWEGSRYFQYFTDFESADNYNTWYQDPNVFQHWRGNPADGSWWWFRLPVYRQDYTDYTATTSGSNTSVKSSKVKIDSKTCPKTLKIVTGSSVASAVRVTCSGKTLRRGTDYTIKYVVYKSGKVKVIIKGIGKYSGTITKYFKIVPKKSSVKTLKCSGKKITVCWKSISGVSGYQIQCCRSPKFKSGCKTIRVKGCSKKSKTVCNLKSGKKYYIRIRVYLIIDGKTFWSSWSGIKGITTMSKSVQHKLYKSTMRKYKVVMSSRAKENNYKDYKTYYVYADIDNNGIDELILRSKTSVSTDSGEIYTGRDSGYAESTNIYTIDNGKVKTLIDNASSWGFWHSFYVRVFKGSSYIDRGWSSGQGSMQFYKLSKGKLSSEPRYVLSKDYYGNYTINEKKVSKATYNKKKKTLSNSYNKGYRMKAF